ncbi:MAG TPA: phosphate ABC transporter substrate-binding protein PstS [Bryobacteraceae bacterium]|jgi:phosphate transport system substrate-binding protein|nr:phosphate ABC transporter substrate-binding protein PstS [Bryobacteraceae bacterium]
MRKTALLCAALVAGGATMAMAQQINAAGATFPAAIYQKWFEEYHKLHSNVQVNYQSIGSGGGIAQLTAETVDFGASDMPMRPDQMSKLKVPVLHFPTVLGGIVPTYNIPGAAAVLKFTPETLAGIYLGTIKKWNDPKLVADNPGAKLPGNDIVVVHRSDGSGTTFVFTDYLSKVSPEWKSKVGSDTSVSWPVGVGGKGNEGVAGVVKQTPNSIGYVELFYALGTKMSYGEVKNSAGKFLRADLNSVTAAAAGAAKNMPADFRVSITNSPGAGAYPIASFTWMLIPSEIKDTAKENAIKAFLHWMLTDGQKYAAALDYAPLPKEVVAKEEAQIARIK